MPPAGQTACLLRSHRSGKPRDTCLCPLQGPRGSLKSAEGTCASFPSIPAPCALQRDTLKLLGFHLSPLHLLNPGHQGAVSSAGPGAGCHLAPGQQQSHPVGFLQGPQVSQDLVRRGGRPPPRVLLCGPDSRSFLSPSGHTEEAWGWGASCLCPCTGGALEAGLGLNLSLWCPLQVPTPGPSAQVGKWHGCWFPGTPGTKCHKQGSVKGQSLFPHSPRDQPCEAEVWAGRFPLQALRESSPAPPSPWWLPAAWAHAQGSPPGVSSRKDSGHWALGPP